MRSREEAMIENSTALEPSAITAQHSAKPNTGKLPTRHHAFVRRLLATSRTARLALVFATPLLLVVSLANAEISSRRILPSETFKRFHVSGSDYKTALEGCKAARTDPDWKALRADKPNAGGGVNCLYMNKAGKHSQQVGPSLVLRCPDKSAPYYSDGINDANERKCVCFEGYIFDGNKGDPKCIARVREPTKICDDPTYDKLSDAVDERKKDPGGGCPEKSPKAPYRKLTCDEAKLKLAKKTALLASRLEFERVCFATIDEGHQKQIDDFTQSVKTCEAAVADKCTTSSAK